MDDKSKYLEGLIETVLIPGKLEEFVTQVSPLSPDSVTTIYGDEKLTSLLKDIITEKDVAGKIAKAKVLGDAVKVSSVLYSDITNKELFGSMGRDQFPNVVNNEDINAKVNPIKSVDGLADTVTKEIKTLASSINTLKRVKGTLDPLFAEEQNANFAGGPGVEVVTGINSPSTVPASVPPDSEHVKVFSDDVAVGDVYNGRKVVAIAEEINPIDGQKLYSIELDDRTVIRSASGTEVTFSLQPQHQNFDKLGPTKDGKIGRETFPGSGVFKAHDTQQNPTGSQPNTSSEYDEDDEFGEEDIANAVLAAKENFEEQDSQNDINMEDDMNEELNYSEELAIADFQNGVRTYGENFSVIFDYHNADSNFSEDEYLQAFDELEKLEQKDPLVQVSNKVDALNEKLDLLASNEDPEENTEDQNDEDVFSEFFEGCENVEFDEENDIVYAEIDGDIIAFDDNEGMVYYYDEDDESFEPFSDYENFARSVPLTAADFRNIPFLLKMAAYKPNRNSKAQKEIWGALRRQIPKQAFKLPKKYWGAAKKFGINMGTGAAGATRALGKGASKAAKNIYEGKGGLKGLGKAIGGAFNSGWTKHGVAGKIATIGVPTLIAGGITAGGIGIAKGVKAIKRRAAANRIEEQEKKPVMIAASEGSSGYGIIGPGVQEVLTNTIGDREFAEDDLKQALVLATDCVVEGENRRVNADESFAEGEILFDAIQHQVGDIVPITEDYSGEVVEILPLPEGMADSNTVYQLVFSDGRIANVTAEGNPWMVYSEDGESAMIPINKFSSYTDTEGNEYSEVDLGLLHPEFEALESFSDEDYAEFGAKNSKSAIITQATGLPPASGGRASAMAAANQADEAYKEGAKLADIKNMTTAELTSHARSLGINAKQVIQGYNDAKNAYAAAGAKREASGQGMIAGTTGYSEGQQNFSQGNEYANFSADDYNNNLDEVSAWVNNTNI